MNENVNKEAAKHERKNKVKQNLGFQMTDHTPDWLGHVQEPTRTIVPKAGDDGQSTPVQTIDVL